VFGQPLHRRRRSQRLALQQLPGRLGDGIHDAWHRKRDQPTGLDRLFGHRGPDPARVGEIQQHRGRQYTLTPMAFQSGLGGRIVEKEQK
jgi:hypothetical protein